MVRKPDFFRRALGREAMERMRRAQGALSEGHAHFGSLETRDERAFQRPDINTEKRNMQERVAGKEIRRIEATLHDKMPEHAEGLMRIFSEEVEMNEQGAHVNPRELHLKLAKFFEEAIPASDKRTVDRIKRWIRYLMVGVSAETDNPAYRDYANQALSLRV